MDRRPIDFVVLDGPEGLLVAENRQLKQQHDVDKQSMKQAFLIYGDFFARLAVSVQQIGRPQDQPNQIIQNGLVHAVEN